MRFQVPVDPTIPLVSAILLSQAWVWALGLPLELADGTCGTEGGKEHQ